MSCFEDFDEIGNGCICGFVGALICIVAIALATYFSRYSLNKSISESNCPVITNSEFISISGNPKEIDRQTTIKCEHFSEFVDGHDYLMFYHIDHSGSSVHFVHNPECKKCNE